jgi:hypothetical protein
VTAKPVGLIGSDVAQHLIRAARAISHSSLLKPDTNNKCKISLDAIGMIPMCATLYNSTLKIKNKKLVKTASLLSLRYKVKYVLKLPLCRQIPAK